MKSTSHEVQVRGVPICRGIAIGKSFFFNYAQDAIPEVLIADGQIEQEINYYRLALKSSREEIEALKLQLEAEGGVDGAAILEAHLQMMLDPLLTANIEKEIRDLKKSAAFVFQTQIQEYQKKFSSIADPFFRERFKDIQAISRRIMGHLWAGSRISLTDIPHNSIVFAQELAASDSAEAKAGAVSAFVTKHGGATSHAAIVAKAKGIPYVANVNLNQFKHHKESVVIVDGRTGDVLVNPSEANLMKYQLLQKQLVAHFRRLEKAGGLKAETIDGYTLRLSGNIDVVSELDMLHQYGGSGIGLFRSEFIFLSKSRLPSEEEQFNIYRNIAGKLNGLPFVIRTFDIAQDSFSASRVPLEGNPFLGCRAIRFLLKEKTIFKTQLRAILRASLFGNIKIMFPMISSLSELLEAKSIVKEVQEELALSGIKIERLPPIGCMIEVPSAAIIADFLAKECDFLSIGTNDLVQYSIAVDRDNQTISSLYNPAHPSILRLIRMVVMKANQQGVPVTICGEIAGDPRFTPLLLGLGVHELSVSARYIPTIKNAIRSTYLLAASKLVDQALALTTAQEVQALLNEEYKKNVPEDFIYNY